MMSRPAPPTPPRILRSLIGACAAPADRRALLDDLDALYAERVRARGRGPALAWYARQGLGFAVHTTVFRISVTVRGLDACRLDAVQALRYFGKRPSFAIAAVLTLGVGTGVLATVYAAANWVMLRPVPGIDVRGLMLLRLGGTDAPEHVSYQVSHPDLLTLRQRLPVDGTLAGSLPVDVDISPPAGVPRRVAGQVVTANYFEVLGTRLSAGRGFGSEDDSPGDGPAGVVVSDRLARSFASEPRDALGTDVRVNGRILTVIGVGPPAFGGADLPGRTDIWLPLGAIAYADPSIDVTTLSARGEGLWRRMYLRASPETSGESLEAAANGIMEAVRREHRIHSYGARAHRLQVFDVGLDPAVRTTVRRTLTMLGAAAVLLLSLAVANLANLAAIESLSRGRATAIRVALGAGSVRLVRAALIETGLLATGGTVVALALVAIWSRTFQSVQLSPYGGRLEGMHIGDEVAAMTALAALTAGLAGLFRPATTGVVAIETLLRRGHTDGRRGERVRRWLVGAQVAVSVVLLVGAGLLSRSAANLRDVPLGFDPDRLLVFSLDPHLHGYESERLDQFATETEHRLAAIGGVSAAGFVSPSPLRGSYVTASLYGGSDPEVRPLVGAGYYVTPGFLRALGATFVAGDADWRGEPGTVVITRDAAAQLFPGEPPHALIGRMLPTRSRGRVPVRLAGIIEAVHLSWIKADAPPTFFRPLEERPPGWSFSGLLSTTAAPLRIAPDVRRLIAERAPDLPVFDVRTARAAVNLQFAELQALAFVTTTLSAIGVALAGIGLFGVLANQVASRRREIGIRSALGAAPARVVRGVVMNGVWPVAAGAAIGLGGATAASRVIQSHLFGLEAFDRGSYAMAIASVIAITAAACALPAWRATRIAPATVLREE